MMTIFRQEILHLIAKSTEATQNITTLILSSPMLAALDSSQFNTHQATSRWVPL